MKSYREVLKLNPDLKKISGFIIDILKDSTQNPSVCMKVYHYVFSFCSKGEPCKYKNITPENKFEIINFNGKVLYSIIKKVLSNHFSTIKQDIAEGGCDFLTTYMNKWNKMILSAKVLDTVFSYVNRHWVNRQLEQSSKKVCDIYQLVMNKWTKIVFFSFHQRLTAEVFKIINNDRETQDDRMLNVKLFCDHLHQLTLEDKKQLKSICTIFNTLYRSNFEEPFIKMTCEYYKKIRDSIYERETTIGYLKSVKLTLIREEERMNEYVNSGTHTRVSSMLEELFILPYTQVIYSEFEKMLKTERYDDLSFLYQMVNKQNVVVLYFKQYFGSCVKRGTIERLRKIYNYQSMSPMIFMKECLDLLHKYNLIVNDSFQNHSLFEESKNMAFSCALNNYLDKSTNASVTAKMIADCANEILSLSNNIKGQEIVNLELNNLLSLILFIEDKESFKNRCVECLSHRLIDNNYVSFEMELNFIAILAKNFDNDFVNEMRRIISDMEESKLLLKAFNCKSANVFGLTSSVIEFNPIIAASIAWPFQHFSNSIIPSQISYLCKNFESWYFSQFNGRRIQWLNHLSRAEIILEFCHIAYHINLPGFHLFVLQLFQLKHSYTYGELVSLTALKSSILSQVISSLIKANILCTSQEKKNLKKKDFSNDLIINFNNDFSSINSSIRIDCIIKIKRKKTHDVNSGISDNWSYAVQAAIVGILKSRKSLDEETLLSMVKNKLLRFEITDEIIRTNLHGMLQRELIYKIENSNIYTYEKEA